MTHLQSDVALYVWLVCTFGVSAVSGYLDYYRRKESDAQLIANLRAEQVERDLFVHKLRELNGEISRRREIEKSN